MKNPRLLILEPNTGISSPATDALEPLGWRISSRSRAKEALSLLGDTARERPFTLFIIDFSLDTAAVDQVLKTARQVSPLTQRMLMVNGETPGTEAQQISTLLSAINRAGINACMTQPFTPEDIRSQAATCLKHHRAMIKRLHLKGFTRNQNQKLFHLARRLERREDQLTRNIEAKQRQIQRLRAAPGSAQERPGPLHLLEKRLATDPEPLCRERLQEEYQHLNAYVARFFNRLARDMDLKQVSLQDPAPSPAQTQWIARFLDHVYTAARPGPDPVVPRPNAAPGEIPLVLEVSSDRLTAVLSPSSSDHAVSIKSALQIHALLDDRGLVQGRIPPADIDQWFNPPQGPQSPLTVAQGTPPTQGVDGDLVYAFPTDRLGPGKIREDGSMDFRDRGEVPFVHQGDLLVTYTAPTFGSDGIDVFGEPIEPDPVNDPVFIDGVGTRLSPDGQTLLAALDGQPALSPAGEVSVSPELVIDGDVDFETGHIEFKGNVVVKGCVKPGFSVQCIQLTAQEIQGATITIQGDLCVTAGITEAQVIAQGNVFCKFVNRAKILAFGNLMVGREIMDAHVEISGHCLNTEGLIVSSDIAARRGIGAKRIGTDTASASRLKVGGDDHAQGAAQALDQNIAAGRGRISHLAHCIGELEAEEQGLYREIKARGEAQDRAKERIAQIRRTIAAQDHPPKGPTQALETLRHWSGKVRSAEAQLSHIFVRQDEIAQEIQGLRNEIKAVETDNGQCLARKKAIREFCRNHPPVAAVEVKGRICQGTTIQGPNATLVLKTDLADRHFRETVQKAAGKNAYQIQMSES